MHVTFIQTGGTIDKDYPNDDAKHGYGFETGAPAFREALSRIPHLCTLDFLEVTRKDSTDLTDEDRTSIRRAVEECPTERIVVTHGSATIGKTARTLDGLKDKTIVLTGSVLPAKFKDSDADFNLGMALAAVQTLSPGIYIALFGRVVPWQEFEALNEEYERKRKIRV